MLRLLSFLLLTFTLTIGIATAQTYNPELERWDYRSDIKFTGTLKLPTKTTTQRNALTAAEGMVIYNTTLDSVQVYRNSSWVTLGGGSAGGGESLWEESGGTLQPIDAPTSFSLETGNQALNITNGMSALRYANGDTAILLSLDRNDISLRTGNGTDTSLFEIGAASARVMSDFLYVSNTDTTGYMQFSDGGVWQILSNDGADNFYGIQIGSLGTVFATSGGNYLFPSASSTNGKVLGVTNGGGNPIELGWLDGITEQAALTAQNDTTGIVGTASAPTFGPVMYATFVSLIQRVAQLENRLSLVGILPEE